jgi:SAM-dependent methyltransferase
LTCPICGETAGWPIPYQRTPELDAWRAEATEATDYAWRLCRQCGNGYPTARPNLRALGRIWETARMTGEDDPAQAAALWQQRRSAARIHAERSYRLFAPPSAGKIGRFLDIACGLGETVRRFADRGWEAEGIDADPTMLAFHREIGIRSRIGQIENLDIVGAYDLIHIAHAIYFITDPMQFLRKLQWHLAPGGHLCIVLSDFASSADCGLPHYSHTFYPVAQSMRYALALAGFETIHDRKWSGSVYMMARSADVAPPRISSDLIYWSYRTKSLRYAVIGRPILAARQIAKMLIRR